MCCSNQTCAFFAFVIIVLLLSGAVCIGLSLGQRFERDAAVEAGVGRWPVDTELGTKQFEYFSPCEKRTK